VQVINKNSKTSLSALPGSVVPRDRNSTFEQRQETPNIVFFSHRFSVLRGQD
jgi:hypothetical protein